MSASTNRESLELLVRYAPTVSTAVEFTLEVQGDGATLTMHERVDMGEVHDVALFSLLVGLRQMGSSMTGRGPGDVAVDLPIEQPDYFPRFAHLLPHARFGQDGTRIHFNAKALDHALVNPDRAALALAKQACEQQLEALGFDRQLPHRIKRLLGKGSDYPGAEEVATALHVSSRTLKRKLAAEGLTFSAIVQAHRLERARELLRSPDLSVEEVALRLDYAGLPSFGRAFRRWTGETPAQYRRRHR